MTRCEGVLYPDLRVLGGEAALARPPIPVACPDSGGTDASARDGFAWLAGIPPPVRILDASMVWAPCPARSRMPGCQWRRPPCRILP